MNEEPSSSAGEAPVEEAPAAAEEAAPAELAEVLVPRGSCGGAPLFINFNQDRSLVAVGRENGYTIYQCEPFCLMYTKQDSSYSIIEMLFRSSLVALVGTCDKPTNSVRKVQVWNTKTDTDLQTMNFDTAVLALRMNMKRLIVVLENRLHIHDLQTLKNLMIVHTEPNKKGLCALSPNNEKWDQCFMAYPHGATAGEVVLYDALNLQISAIKPAHNSPLSCLMFNLEGTMLATASDKGTVIRVFDTPEGNLLYSFRRGSYPAEIYSIAFNLDSSLIGVSSNTATVHIFKLDEANRKGSEEQASTVVGYLGGYMPGMVTDQFDPRSYAQVKLKAAGMQCLCALHTNSATGNTIIHVVTADGFFYTYEMPEAGGECILKKEAAIM